MWLNLTFYALTFLGGLAIGLAFWWSQKKENKEKITLVRKAKEAIKSLKENLYMTQAALKKAEKKTAIEKRRADLLDQELKQLMVEVEQLQKAKGELLGHLRRKKGPKKAAKIASRLPSGK